MNHKTLGQIAFEAYRKAKWGKTHDDKIIPHWDVLGEDVREAWEAAALAVKDEVLDQVQEAGMNFSQ